MFNYMIIFFYMFNYNMIKGLYISYISCHSLYSLFVVSTITHQKRLGLDSIHGLSVDNQIFCTTKDLSVLSGALVHFCCFMSIISEKDFCKVEKGIILNLYNQQNHFLRVDQTFSIKKVKIFKIMIVA